MANEEALTLDGLALNDGTVLGITSLSAPPPRQRQDWIGAADSEAQLLFRNPLHDNRKITVKLAVLTQSTMDLAHDKIALVIDKLQKASKTPDGIAMTWTPATGTRTVTFDVLAGEIVDLPIDWENGWLAKSPEITVELTAMPYWRGTETLTSTASSSTPFVTKEITGVTGDVPALGRLIVTDTASQSRRHVEWGIEGQYYNAATSLLIDSDDMVVSGYAGVMSTATGAYDPNAAGNSTVTLTSLPTALTTALCGVGNLSHVGTFRVKARVQSGSLNNLFRLTWRAGDGPMTNNPWASPVSTASWVELDLGTITIPVASVGTQRWTGQIEVFAAAATAGGAIIDYLTLIPQQEGYGKARATYSYTPGVIAGYDSFVGTTAAAALSARVAPLGGTWATSGDATDLVFDDNFVSGDAVESVKRSTVVVETSGRFAVLGSTNYTDLQVELNVINLAAGAEASLIGRWVDSSNYLRFRVPVTTAYPGGTETAYLETVVAGTVAVIGQTTWVRTIRPYRFRLVVFASGRAIAAIFDMSGALVTTIDATSSALATAGTLASGKPGFRDRATSTLAAQRNYTTLSVSVPSTEAVVVYSGRNMQIRHDDTIRQDSTGTYTGRPQSYRGSRFLVPVGTSRVLVKARRNDIDVNVDDQVLDATQIQIGWTPRGLAVPRA